MKQNKKMNYYIEIFLKSSYIRNKRSTYTIYEYMIYKHIYPYFKDYRASNIDISTILSFIEFLSSNGLKNKSIKDILVLLNSILKLANISLDIPYPKLGNNKIKVFSREEQYLLEKELLKDITPITLGIYLSLYTGLRIGEICALNIHDIDFKKKKIYIRHTLTRVKNFR